MGCLVRQCVAGAIAGATSRTPAEKLDYSSRPLAKGARACVGHGVWCGVCGVWCGACLSRVSWRVVCVVAVWRWCGVWCVVCGVWCVVCVVVVCVWVYGDVEVGRRLRWTSWRPGRG